ncbi:DUF3019 domain-containing protein [Shewanella sp. Isolate11]|nr:DUF3019 domain-containing protein [Shewanella sp. Isolate11]MCG9695831.1 DUF3019 domain-containing protein [Shewanella sp. Isolate11]
MNRLLQTALVFITLVSSAFASNDLVNATLSLSPQFCITTQPDQSCEVELELKWQTQTSQTVCLMSDHQSLTHWCAPSEEIHSYAVNVSTNRDIQFMLIDKETNQTLATKKLKITPTAEPKYRSRYQKPWSLF